MRILVCGFCTQDIIEGKDYFGGSAAGIALNLSQFGVDVGIISVLGNDEFSRLYNQELEKHHVDTLLLNCSLKHLPVLTVTDKGNTERSRLFNDFGAKEKLSNLTPDPTALNSFDIIHITNTPPAFCNYLAIHFTGIISYSPGSLLVRDNSSLSKELLKKTQYLFCNEEEYSILVQKITVEKLLNASLKYLCITKSEKGLTIVSKNEKKDFPAVSVSKIIDTTGAGDAIVVGVLKNLSTKRSYENGLKVGLQFASLVVSKQGTLFTTE